MWSRIDYFHSVCMHSGGCIAIDEGIDKRLRATMYDRLLCQVLLELALWGDIREITITHKS